MKEKELECLRSVLNIGLCCTKPSPYERMDMREVAARLRGLPQQQLRIVIVRFHLCSKASGRQQRRGRREGLRDLLANATHILRLHGSVQEWTTAGLPEYQCSHDLGDVAGHRDDVHLVLFLVSDVSFADMWLTSTSAELIDTHRGNVYQLCWDWITAEHTDRTKSGHINWLWAFTWVEPCGDRRRMVSALQPGTDLPAAMSSLHALRIRGNYIATLIADLSRKLASGPALGLFGKLLGDRRAAPIKGAAPIPKGACYYPGKDVLRVIACAVCPRQRRQRWLADA
uniref:Uncharacterized protein n=1 Tax=Oryza barthii TaxID=65489 RepID=A0A0D3HIS8_9ORYZ